MNVKLKTPLYQVPLPSTQFEGDTTLCGHVLHFQYYREGILHRNGIKFNHVSASRTRAERSCQAWHIEDVYDTLVEIGRSSWLEEVQFDTQEMWKKKWEMHHYMIYLDSAGCFEVIAESWEPLPEEAGS